MPMQAMSAISSGANTFGSIFGGFQQLQMQHWVQDALTNALGKLTQGGEAGQNIFNNYAPAAGAPASQNVNNLMQYLHGTAGSPGLLPGLQSRLENFQNNIPGIYTGNQFAGNSATDAASSGMLGGANKLGGLQDTASQVFNGGGWTPQGQQGFDAIAKLLGMSSSGDQALQTSGGVANELLSNRGQTAFTQDMSKFAGSQMSQGGYTPQMQEISKILNSLIGSGGNTQGQDALRSTASNVIGQNGLTPTGSTGEGVALQGLLRGGDNPILSALSNSGLDKATRESVMSPLAARGMAMNDAATGYKGLAEQAYGKALARGGGPGVTVANGMQNQSLADFNDQISQGVSKAGLDALMGHESLGLQQSQMGSQQALGAQNSQQNFLNTFGNQLTGLEGVAAGRFGTGTSALQGAESLNNQRLLQGLGIGNETQGTANQLQQIMGQLGLGAGNLDLSRLTQGANQAQGLGQLNLGGIQGLTSLLGNQNQYALGAGQLANSAGSNQGNILAQLMSGQQGLGQLALGQNNGILNSLQQGHSNMLNLGSLMNNSLTQSFNPLVSLAGQGSNIYQQGLQSIGGLFSGAGATLAKPAFTP